MNERRDDTTKPEAESPADGGRSRYYYDDATGYETYDPEADEEKDEGGRMRDEEGSQKDEG